MTRLKVLATLLSGIIIAGGFSLSITSAANEIPVMPSGNVNLYNGNAGIANGNIANAAINEPLFTHSNGVLSSTAKNFENSCVLSTGMSIQSQALKVDNNSMVNIDTLTFVTKTKITITEGAIENWQGASLVLRYEEGTNNVMTLRYSPSYNSNEGCLRLIGSNNGNLDYPVTRTTGTNARDIDLAVVQTKNLISAYVNNVHIFDYTISDNSSYKTMSFAFGLNAVYSLCEASQTSLYFAERVKLLSIPEMPSDNLDLYNPNAILMNPNLTGETSTTPFLTHSNGELASTRKTFENGGIIRTAITGLQQMTNYSNNTETNIDNLTYVIKTKMTIEDIGSESWHGASIVMRYDENTKNYLLLRYSKDGKLRITGFYGGTIDYLTETTIMKTNSIDVAVSQTKNNIAVFINDIPTIKYALPEMSNYAAMPYSFGLKSVYSVSRLSQTSLYFAEHVKFISAPPMPEGNQNLYTANAELYEANAYKNANVSFSNTNGVMKSNSKSGENLCVIDSAITGQAQIENPVDKTKIEMESLTFVAKTTLAMEDIGSENWNGAGFVLRYDPKTGLRLMLRYSKDGKLRITGFNIDKVDWLSETSISIVDQLNLTVVQRVNSIVVYQDDLPVLLYTLPVESIYTHIPYAFGLYVVDSVSTLSNSTVYFAERVDVREKVIPIVLSKTIPPMPDGNRNLYNGSAKFLVPSIMGLSEVDFINANGSLRNTSTGGENAGVIETAISGKDIMNNPITNAYVKIKNLTLVIKSKLTIEDIGSESWHGAGIILRFDKTQNNRMILRYSQDGKLRITGDYNGVRDYLAEVTVAKAKVLNLAVIQTNNIIRVFSDDKLIIHVELAAESNYLNMPYSFGLYSAFCLGNLTKTSIYFAERVDTTNKIYYSNAPTGDRGVPVDRSILIIALLCIIFLLYGKRQCINKWYNRIPGLL